MAVGELDSAIEAASVKVRERFGKLNSNQYLHENDANSPRVSSLEFFISYWKGRIA
jgi:hypothetical protein